VPDVRLRCVQRAPPYLVSCDAHARTERPAACLSRRRARSGSAGVIPMKDAQPKAMHLSEYRPPDHVTTDTRLTFEISPDTTRVTAELTVERRGRASSLRLDGQHLELESVAVDGRVLSSNEYQLDDDSLTL